MMKAIIWALLMPPWFVSLLEVVAGKRLTVGSQLPVIFSSIHAPDTSTKKTTVINRFNMIHDCVEGEVSLIERNFKIVRYKGLCRATKKRAVSRLGAREQSRSRLTMKRRETVHKWFLWHIKKS